MNFRYYTPTENKDSLLEKGRVSFTEQGLLMDWSACGFALNFSGSGISFTFEPYHEAQPVYVLTILDGIRRKFAITDGSERLILDCADGVHTLTFLRLSEGGVPLVCNMIRVSSENGESSPVLLPPPAAKPRRIVFFGDSITCGYGNLADPTGDYRTSEQDPTRAYAYRCAELLGADAELVSISGQGIVRNCNGDIGTLIPVFYAWQSRALMTPCDFADQPDVVVINAGTNDTGGKVSKEDFYSGCVGFLRDLRKAYPKAEIVWYYGLMGLWYDETLAKVQADIGEEIGHFTYLPVEPIYGRPGEVAAHGHPSVEGDERGAQVLANKIRALMNW